MSPLRRHENCDENEAGMSPLHVMSPLQRSRDTPLRSRDNQQGQGRPPRLYYTLLNAVCEQTGN